MSARTHARQPSSAQIELKQALLFYCSNTKAVGDEIYRTIFAADGLFLPGGVIVLDLLSRILDRLLSFPILVNTLGEMCSVLLSAPASLAANRRTV